MEPAAVGKLQHLRRFAGVRRGPAAVPDFLITPTPDEEAVEVDRFAGIDDLPAIENDFAALHLDFHLRLARREGEQQRGGKCGAVFHRS